VSFPTFSPGHLAILAAVPLAAGALSALSRRRPGAARPIRLGLASALALVELAAYARAAAAGVLRPPHGLPLDLCDVTPWITAWALVARGQWALEIAWFLGLGGAGMAVLTPDVGAEPVSWEAALFFLSHGGVAVSALFLALSGALRPRRDAWLRAFLWVNAFGALVALFNWRFGTNYMYLREKPASGTLLDLLGPWPWYVVAVEPVALLLLFLLDLPFRRSRAAAAARSGATLPDAGRPARR
jgi:hypothetical integral membrane protein (TIGR02206 family)